MITTRSLRATLTLALMLASAPASAGVVYQWHAIENPDTLVPQNGRLEITEAAWRAGSLSVIQSGSYAGGEPDFTFPDSPLISISFTANDKTVAINPITGESSFLSDWYLEASLGIGPAGDYLTGSLDANNSESNFAMGSGGRVWGIPLFASDDPIAGCAEAPYCFGATGEWLLDATTVPTAVSVPEPPFGTLFGLGAGLMLWWYGLRQKASTAA